MSQDKITVTNSPPINVTVQPAGAPGPPVSVASIAGVVLSPSSPKVLELGNINEWTVNGNVQIQLPVVDAGSQFTVHVKSGFQGITWPNGTQVYGATDQNVDVPVTLNRTLAGWTVYIPSVGGGSGMIDTGWQLLLNVANLGSGLQFHTGNASMISAGWTVTTSTLLTSVAVRRTGQLLLVDIVGGFTKESGAGSVFAEIPLPGLVVMDMSHGRWALNTAIVGGTPTPRTYEARIISGNRLRLSLDGVTADGTVTRLSGTLMFAIDPSSTWGD